MSMLSLKLPLCEMNTEKAEIEVGGREGEVRKKEEGRGKRERRRKGGGSEREGGREGEEREKEEGRGRKRVRKGGQEVCRREGRRETDRGRDSGLVPWCFFSGPVCSDGATQNVL